MVGVAVKVIGSPAQEGLAPVVIETLTAGVNADETTIVIPVLVAVAGLAQAELDVIWHVTTCPFVSVDVVKVEAVLPAFTPSIFH
ncbi:hypothetical protein DSECCO2_646750 [anaerobic digester metagenome]